MPEETVPKDVTAETPEVIPSRELKVLYSWKAPSRPFKKRDREFWTTVLAIVFLVGLILFFVHEWFLIATIASLTFVYYVLSTVPPEEVEYTLTNRGLISGGQSYPWESFTQFWFSQKYSQKMVNFELQTGLNGRISMMVNDSQIPEIKAVLIKYLIEQEASPSMMDNAARWLEKNVPLERTKKSKFIDKNPSPK